MTNPVLQAIAERRSNRGYKPDQITQVQLDILLTAAQQAPSASNRQPWHFTVVQNQEIIREVNEETCRIREREGDVFYGAPTTIFLSCDRSSRWGLHDCAYAVQNIALAAHSIGLGSVILGLPDAAFIGERKEYFHQLLKFPEGYDFAVAIAVGVPTVTKEAHPIHPDRITYIGENQALPEITHKNVLAALQALGGSAETQEVYAKVAEMLNLTDEQTNIPYSDSADTTFKRSVRGHRQYLVYVGLFKDSSPHGVWELTEKGRAYSPLTHE